MERTELLPPVKTESAQGRTYGECIMDEIMSIQMIDGQFRTTLQIKEKPKRLSREKALIYYTQKLRCIWESIEK